MLQNKMFINCHLKCYLLQKFQNLIIKILLKVITLVQVLKPKLILIKFGIIYCKLNNLIGKIN